MANRQEHMQHYSCNLLSCLANQNSNSQMPKSSETSSQLRGGKSGSRHRDTWNLSKSSSFIPLLFHVFVQFRPRHQIELPKGGPIFWVFFVWGGVFFFFAFPWFFLGKTAVSFRCGRIWRDFPWFSYEKSMFLSLIFLRENM